MNNGSLSGGFRDPARDSALAFRAALNAMAHPGQMQPITGAKPPAPLSVAAGTLLLTLTDSDTAVCLQGPYDCPAVQQWLRFHTGARLVAAAHAEYVLTDWQQALPLSQFAQGSHEYPDRSATLIIEIDPATGSDLILTGPGLAEPQGICLPEARALQANHKRFPLGVDFYLTCGTQVAGLPRSTKVESA